MQDVRHLSAFDKFVKCVEEHHLFTPETNIILGVSGGADSVCMLVLMRAYMDSKYLTVAHMNHGIRDDEADRDEAFVQQLCTQLHISFVSESCNVPAYASRYCMGIEEAARTLRYQFLQRLAREKEGVVAVAHTQDDNAETILMHIGRGCGVDGLRGIQYQNDRIIRPILNLSRRDTEEVCRYVGIDFVTDSTNLTDCTLRNKIRHHAIPYLTKLFQQDVKDKLIRLSDNARKDVNFLEKYTQSRIAMLVTQESDSRFIIDRSLFKNEDAAIQYRLIRNILAEIHNQEGDAVYPGGKDLTGDIVHRIVAHICSGRSGKTVEGGRTILCLLEQHRAVIYCASNKTEVPFQTQCFSVQIYDRTQIDLEQTLNNHEITAEFFDKKELDRLRAESNSDIILRLIRPGDRFLPFGGKGHTTVQKFLIDRKVPLSMRKHIWAVCIDDNILWIPGLRRSEIGRITAKTDKIIKLTIESEAVYCGTGKPDGCN